MTRDLDAILASIDGALADDELPDAMRWSPDPAAVDDAGRYPYAEDPSPLHGPSPVQRFAARERLLRPGGVLPPRPLVIFDEPFLPGALPPPEVPPLPLLRALTLSEANGWALRAEQHREQYERDLAALREVFAPAAEALSTLVEAFGRIAEQAGLAFADLADLLGNLGKLDQLPPDQPIPPPRTLRDEDPRAYALQLRQARSTGPYRPSGQRAHRPRVHR